MAEIISLLSSSPLQEPVILTKPKSKSKTRTVSTILTDFDLDVFDTTGDLSFHAEHLASKRRRLSPSPDLPTAAPKSSTSNLPIDLSSEPDLPPPLVLPRNHAGRSEATVLTLGDHLESDTISSSAPELGRQERRQIYSADDGIFNLSSDDLPDDPLQIPEDNIIFSSQPMRGKLSRNGTLKDMNTLVPALSKWTSSSTTTTAPIKVSVSRKKKDDRYPPAALADDIMVSSPPKRQAKEGKRSRTDNAIEPSVTTSVAERAAIKAKKKAEKDAQKIADQDSKRREKEAKAREKQIAADKAEVNKSKINKNDTTSEMIIEMSASLQDTSVGNQIIEYMKELNVDTRFVDEAVNLTGDYDQCYDVRNIVTWKRKVTSEYDEDSDEWVPTARDRVRVEAHFLVYFTAVEFVTLIAGYSTGGEKLTTVDEDVMRQNVDLYLTSIRSMHGKSTPILLIQGLDAWLKKNVNVKNRDYTAAVRSQAVPEDDESNPPAPSSRPKASRRKKPVKPAVDLSFVTLQIVDDLMLHLQLHHRPIVIQRTASPATAASEIVKFTQHLSTRPGRLAFQELNLKSASFCMGSGQVKTGDNVQETYVKMLQEVQRITPSMAYGISSEYQSVIKLVQAFRKDGNLVLEEVHKSTNKDGGWSDRRLGPMVSRRLYKIFMGKDPAATDGMS